MIWSNIRTALRARLQPSQAIPFQTRQTFPWRSPPSHTRCSARPLLYYTLLFYSMLYYTILFFSILFNSFLYYSILFHTILFFSILFYTVPGHHRPPRGQGGRHPQRYNVIILVLLLQSLHYSYCTNIIYTYINDDNSNYHTLSIIISTVILLLYYSIIITIFYYSL